MGEEADDRVLGLARRVELLERQLDAARASAEAFGTQAELDQLVPETLRIAVETVGAVAGSVILYDPEHGKLVFKYVLPQHSAALVGFEMEPSEGIAGAVFTAGKTRVSDDVTSEEEHRRDVAEIVSHKTQNMVTIPLKRPGGDAIGVMQILDKVEGLFTDDDCAVLELLAGQAAMMVENARLSREARLAEVANRLGDISHDIKNMLTPVESCAQTLEMAFEDAFTNVDAVLGEHPNADPRLVDGINNGLAMLRDFYPDAVEMLVEGATRAQDRVREIADCVKGIVSEPTFAWVDSASIASSVYQPQALVAERAGVTLRLEVPEDLPLAPIDERRVFHAIYNLVSNAIPETPPGGTITIRLRACREGTFSNGESLVIEVEDTGNGMTEEVRSRLFTRDAISTKPGGTGLGTRIVKNAVDAHGGTICVESELGKGSLFRLCLPLERPGMTPPERAGA